MKCYSVADSPMFTVRECHFNPPTHQLFYIFYNLTWYVGFNVYACIP